MAAATRFIQLIPHEFARRHLVLGEAGAGDALLVRHAQGVDPLVLHNVRVRLGGGPTIEAIEAHAETLAHEIDAAYAAAQAPEQPVDARGDATPVIELPTESDAGLDEELSRVAAGADRDLLNLEGKAPVVRLVDSVLFESIGRGASDIHIQPLADATLIRYRIDGVLLTVRRVSPRLAPAIVSRIKVMARMDVAERRAAQDGRATVTVGRVGSRTARAIDLRISSLPSSYGERVVIRLLDTQQGKLNASIEALRMPEQVRQAFLDRAGRSSGIVLVTGPTGSGKTTTLYATLRWLIARSFTGGRSADVNVMTIEDPIEYDLSSADPGGQGLPISQTQVDTKKGITFAHGLRHILRQDPDVIMVGEIRDGDTARIAIQASLTGHLVFSTLHTSDAPGAVARLLDLGVEPYLVASSLSAVLAQRLVRMVHADCAGAGCVGCLHSGYKGRRGIFELLVLDEVIRPLISARANSIELRAAAVKAGMRRLEMEGQRLVDEGVTTRSEVERVTLGAE
ncbi:MAG: GspE/PulE family protein [Phycisphaerales bacterium]